MGARFGWDFVEPTPIYSYRKPTRNLFLHVAYKPLDAAERGLMMPAMKFMSEADTALLWQWLKAVATKPMPAYAPPKTRRVAGSSGNWNGIDHISSAVLVEAIGTLQLFALAPRSGEREG